MNVIFKTLFATTGAKWTRIAMFSALFSGLLLYACKQDTMIKSPDNAYQLDQTIAKGASGVITYCSLPDEFGKYKEAAQVLCNLDQSVISKLVGIVFYHDAQTAKVQLGNNNIINGISIYYVDSKNELNHSVYFKKAEGYVKSLEFDLKTKTILTDDIIFIQQQLNKIQYTPHHHAIVNSAEQFKIKKTASDLNLKTVSKMISNEPGQEIAGRCSAPCKDTDCGCDVFSTTPEQYCDPCICLMREMEQESAVVSNFAKPHLSRYLNLDYYRRFREDFLSQYPIGRTYINYYRAAGHYLSSVDKFDAKVMIETVKILPDVYNSIDVLMEKDSNDKIFITKSQKNNIKNLINLYKGLSNNVDYQTLLTHAEKDVEKFSGLTKKDIIQAISMPNN